MGSFQFDLFLSISQSIEDLKCLSFRFIVVIVVNPVTILSY